MINLSLRHVKQRGTRCISGAPCSKYATGIAVVTVLGRRRNPAWDDGEFVYFGFARSAAGADLHGQSRGHAGRTCWPPELVGINVLAESQAALSVRFARPGEDRFGTVEWRPGESGVPELPGVLAMFECRKNQVIPAGDHQIFVLEAQHVRWREDRPLIYFQSAYHSLA